MKTLNLTQQQIEAIEYSSNLVVLACPGSGKTTVMKEKIRKSIPTLLSHQGVIAMTFTKKASAELKKRCKSNGFITKQSFFGTIDSFCLEEVIYPFLSHLWGGHPNKCKIITELGDLQKKFFKQPYMAPTLDNIINDEIGFTTLYKQNFLWIDSLAGLALYILEKCTAAVRYIKAKYKFIFIDEYQDSSRAQHELFMKFIEIGLIGTAVGDVDQSIYQFRGSDPKCIEELKANSLFKFLTIDQNHRSHISIINYASRLLNPTYPTEPCEEIRIFRGVLAGNPTQAAKKISELIKRITSSHESVNYSDIAILAYRTSSLNYIARGLELDYRLYTDTPLEKIETPEAALIRDILAFRFGKITTMQEIFDMHFAYSNLSKGSLLKIRKILLEIKNLELTQVRNKSIEILALSGVESDCHSELDALTSTLGSENYIKNFMPILTNEVQLMTLHKSKGLEFHTVFHIDLDDWSFPYREYTGSFDDPPVYPQYKQDLNLHYVGITRAKEYCLLVQTTKRFNKQGVEKNTQPSDFLTLPHLETLYKKFK
ncbi:ATP-dependent helicase [Acinetobacter baumannii]|uniref:DNA 3'-5' helicase n=1 Tax=Acinetobacter baumannii TaxID=470 RepID=A0A090B3B9_ACIBA|nr:ATP-dependent helicase [Acinetobacter baumannii]EKX2702397.1 ATP-dependent helicase [Acinetobacter baumannii]EKX9481215.1 ATP-dependent helicase [Acinetobacter baumannii]EKY1322572.1 ATP-dependent helicase [Acinetobacter baumannii]EKY1523808.1 ATP-dependent helicase [Acinetobacter baumannii]KMV02504.1 uvrD/REP helicase N-terminal domain protein [Acinetobacter baumannii]